MIDPLDAMDIVHEGLLEHLLAEKLVKESPTSSAVHVDSLMGNQGGSPRKRKRKKEGLVDAIESLEKAENVPVDKELYARVKAEAKKKFDVYPSAYANAWLVREYKSRGGTYRIEKADSPAWQREAGKNPKGGLNAKGRASYKRETGGTLRPPVKRGDNPRRASFLARMGNMAGPERDANGEPTRLLLSLQAWGANSKAEAREKAKAISARNEEKDKAVEKQAAQRIVEIKVEMRKASFASRSEAGRYAANQRWKNNTKEDMAPSEAVKGNSGREIDMKKIIALGKQDQIDGMREMATSPEDFGRRVDRYIDREAERGVNLTTKRHKNETSDGRRIVPSKLHEDDRMSIEDTSTPAERQQRIDEIASSSFYAGKNIFWSPPKKKVNELERLGIISRA